MSTSLGILMLLLVAGAPADGLHPTPGGIDGEAPGSASDVVRLPAPQTEGKVSLEQALAARRSVRELEGPPLTRGELGQLAWAAQGVTRRWGGRTAPSAGALYPLELYAVTGNGVFHYEPAGHRLRRIVSGDRRPALHRAALRQQPVLEAPSVFVIAAVYERTEKKYGPARTPRYVHIEAGHAAQNLLLQATALGLSAVPIGGFRDDEVADAVALPTTHRPLYLVPVGRRR